MSFMRVVCAALMVAGTPVTVLATPLLNGSFESFTDPAPLGGFPTWRNAYSLTDWTVDGGAILLTSDGPGGVTDYGARDGAYLIELSEGADGRRGAVSQTIDVVPYAIYEVTVAIAKDPTNAGIATGLASFAGVSGDALSDVDLDVSATVALASAIDGSPSVPNWQLYRFFVASPDDRAVLRIEDTTGAITPVTCTNGPINGCGIYVDAVTFGFTGEFVPQPPEPDSVPAAAAGLLFLAGVTGMRKTGLA